MNYEEWAEKIFDRGRLVGVPTGYIELDRMLGGLRKGTVTIMAGSTGMGKSILAINIMVNLAKAGHKVAYLDLENGAELTGERFVRVWHRLPKEWLDDSKHKEEAAQMLEQIFDNNVSYWSPETLQGFGFFDDDRKMMTDILTTLCIGNDVVFIDPLQKLETSNSSDKLLQEQGLLVSKFANLARAHKSAIVVCHHIRKSTTGGGQWVEDTDDIHAPKFKVPSLEDIKGSSKITDFATDVWGFVKTANGKTLLRVLKNRNGATGDVKLQFNASTLVYDDGLSHEENVGLFLKRDKNGL